MLSMPYVSDNIGYLLHVHFVYILLGYIDIAWHYCTLKTQIYL